jgi:4-carboxymuconolactone decarboxylase
MTKKSSLFLPIVFIALVRHLPAQDRMPSIPAAELTDAQKKAVAEVTAPRGGELPGWMVPLLRSPELMVRTKAVGDYLVRSKTALSGKLTEFTILIVARQWTQQYLWTFHQPAAVRAGLSESVTKALAENRVPEGLAEDEQIVFDFCTELQRNRTVSDSTYARAVAKFGEQGVIDTIGVMGYYSTLAMAYNTSRIALPPGAKPQLAPARPAQ